MKRFFPNLGIIQALLQTLNEIFQNAKISTIFLIRVLCFFNIYMISIIGRSQVSECFFNNYLQPPDADAFRHVGIILNLVRYFSMKSMYYLLEV